MSGDAEIITLIAFESEDGHVFFEWHTWIVGIPTFASFEHPRDAGEMALLADLELSIRTEPRWVEYGGVRLTYGWTLTTLSQGDVGFSITVTAHT